MQRFRQVAVHVLHEQAGGDAGPHAWQRVGVERPVGELGLVGGDLLGLGVEAHGAQEGHAPQEHRLHIGHGHIPQEGETRFRRQHPEVFAADADPVADRVGGGGHQADLDEVHHRGDAAHAAIPFGGRQIEEQIAHHPPELPQGMGGGGGADQLRQETGEQRVE